MDHFLSTLSETIQSVVMQSLGTKLTAFADSVASASENGPLTSDQIVKIWTDSVGSVAEPVSPRQKAVVADKPKVEKPKATDKPKVVKPKVEKVVSVSFSDHTKESIAQLTVAELKALLKAENVAFTSKDTKKDVLVGLAMKAFDSQSEDAEVEEVEEVEE